MLSTSGPSVPLFTSASDFLPVARLVSSNFFSAMELLSANRCHNGEPDRGASVRSIAAGHGTIGPVLRRRSSRLFASAKIGGAGLHGRAIESRAKKCARACIARRLQVIPIHVSDRSKVLRCLLAGLISYSTILIN